MKQLLIPVLAACAVFTLAPAAEARGPVFRGDFFQRGNEPDQQRERQVRPLHEIVQDVRGQLDGDFIGLVRLEDWGPRPVYILRWRFSDERVAEIRVDAASGRVIGR